MANRPRPAPVLLTLLLVMVIIACTAQTTVEPAPVYQKGIFAIVVGPDPCDLHGNSHVQISKRDDEIAIWVAKQKNDLLRIEFEKEVFEGMYKGTKGFVPSGCGASRICISGNIKVNPDPSIVYKYWQYLKDSTGGPERPCDGSMIVNP